MAETKSICLDIAGFQSCVLGLEQWVSLVEAHAASSRDREQELLYLRSKVTGLEDRSRRDNVRFLGFPEAIEGKDMHLFLRETLPKLMGITFDPPLEFQRAHRLSPKRPDASARPRTIIACLLRHTQARQIIQRAHAHGSCQMDGKKIRLRVDFSKETSERRRAFLVLRPTLRQMEVKYGLFEPVKMWPRSRTSTCLYRTRTLCLRNPPREGQEQTIILQFPTPEVGTWSALCPATITEDRCCTRWHYIHKWQTGTSLIPL
ncbi:hypothetical protein NDU88_007852 [Pleurodeles waltl]|uniref:Uncharacterized protein n=1 Tax=Pleurodeles waltl TaxID=8319 RepID=A0AAV7N4M7_PLEWA|nr:hypothetical protein NDU88_007852 [Pleurodeles waltl]